MRVVINETTVYSNEGREAIRYNGRVEWDRVCSLSLEQKRAVLSLCQAGETGEWEFYDGGYRRLK